MFFCGGTYYNSDYICANCGILLKCPICAEKTKLSMIDPYLFGNSGVCYYKKPDELIDVNNHFRFKLKVELLSKKNAYLLNIANEVINEVRIRTVALDSLCLLNKSFFLDNVPFKLKSSFGYINYKNYLESLYNEVFQIESGKIQELFKSKLLGLQELNSYAYNILYSSIISAKTNLVRQNASIAGITFIYLLEHPRLVGRNIFLCATDTGMFSLILNELDFDKSIVVDPWALIPQATFYEDSVFSNLKPDFMIRANVMKNKNGCLIRNIYCLISSKKQSNHLRYLQEKKKI